MNSRPSKRYRFRFSMAMMLFIITLFGVWLGSKVNRAHQQRKAIATISALGGEVLFDYQKERPDVVNVFDTKASPHIPQWLINLVGEEYFRHVVLVELRDTGVTDDDLRVLKLLPTVENLDLTNTRITSDGLAHLKSLPNLQYLGLWKTEIDDRGLEHLSGHTRMWALILDETNVTDTGLQHLKGMTNLEEWLGLVNTRVTDAGLDHLRGFTKLRQLNLIRTQVTAEGVKRLQMALPGTDISYDRSTSEFIGTD